MIPLYNLMVLYPRRYLVGSLTAHGRSEVSDRGIGKLQR